MTERTSPPPAPDLSIFHDAVGWMGAERLNLHAAALHAAAAGLPGYAAAIAAAMHNFLRNTGHWDQALTLHMAALEAARASGDRLTEADVLIDVGAMQTILDDYPAAIASLSLAGELYRSLDRPLGVANSLTDLGIAQRLTGDYPAAVASLDRALELHRGLGDELGEARALTDLGVVQAGVAEFAAATASLTRALHLYRSLGNRNGQVNALNYLGGVQRETGNALVVLGVVRRLTGEFPAAIEALEASLLMSGGLGDQLGRANALLVL